MAVDDENRVLRPIGHPRRCSDLVFHSYEQRHPSCSRISACSGQAATPSRVTSSSPGFTS